MRILVQWTTRTPHDYVEMDSSDWAALPTKPVPVGGESLDEGEGWVADLVVQGVSFAGADHYAVEDLPGGALRVTTWTDDPDDYPQDQFWADVWTFLPLAPDPLLGGAWNTRQSHVWYARPWNRRKFDGVSVDFEIRRLREFSPPPDAVVRHGISAPTGLYQRIERRRSFHGWREWTDGVPADLVEEGAVIQQRKAGRYARTRGTRTYFARDVKRSTDAHVASREFQFELTTGTAATVSETIMGNADELVFVFTTPVGEPDSANWPNGLYRWQIDVFAAGAQITYGMLTLGLSAGHFARVADGADPPGADVETWTQTQAAFSGTGLNIASRTIDPAAGTADERWEALLAGQNTNSMNQSIELELNESDDFTDGPWPDGAVTLTPAPVVANFVVPTPTVVAGPVTLQPAPTTAAWGVPSPVVIQTLLPGPASAAWGVPTPTVVAGPVTLTPVAATAAWGVPTPTISPGPITLSPAPVSAAWGVPTPLVIQTLLPAPVTAAWGVPTPTVVAGPITLSPAPTLANFVVPTPTLQIGAVTLQPGAVVANWFVPTPTIFSGVTLTPAPAVATWGVPTPTVVAGPFTITPAPAVAAWGVPTPTVSPGPVTLSPGPASASFVVPAPVLLSVKTLTPAAVSASFVVPTPTVVPGPFTLAPAPAQAAWGVPVPTVVIGGVTLSPGAAVATWLVPTPTIVLGLALTEFGTATFVDRDLGTEETGDE